MVKYYRSEHIYDHDFTTAAMSFFLRYPNPYSRHVRSTDTISRHIDSEGRLHSTRLILKKGKLPEWFTTLFASTSYAKISESWVLEESIVDPKKEEIVSIVRNLDYRKLMSVKEYTRYQGIPAGNGVGQRAKVEQSAHVRISSNLGLRMMRERIEVWGQTRFRENLVKSRMGMQFVMDKFREQGGRMKGFKTAMQTALSQDPVVL
ncbi:PRELI-like family-domain-containing protein [Dipodascopsis tothii]|uniref:PRELI-like family-domain-containing protein n=1 Tax=Dipodascopsis tothii TaxID=44089 RepID=UPI0034CD0EFE